MWKLASVPILLVGLCGVVTMPAGETIPTAVPKLSAGADARLGDEAPLKDSLNGKLRQEDEGSAFWRGKRPRICTVADCPKAEPTYCVVEKGPRVKAVEPRGESCDREPWFRDAARLKI